MKAGKSPGAAAPGGHLARRGETRGEEESVGTAFYVYAMTAVFVLILSCIDCFSNISREGGGMAGDAKKSLYSRVMCNCR